MGCHVEELCKLFALPEKSLKTSFTFAWATGLEASATRNHAPRYRERGWNDGWFSEASLPAAAEDQSESAEAEKGGGGGLGHGDAGDVSEC